MKKKIIGVTMFAAIAIATSWNFTQGENKINLSDLALTNIEALAGCEKIAGSCWLDSWNKCCDGGDYGCAPCDN